MQKKKKFDGIAKQALDFPLGSNLRGEAYKGNRAERGGGTCGTKLYTFDRHFHIGKSRRSPPCYLFRERRMSSLHFHRVLHTGALHDSPFISPNNYEVSKNLQCLRESLQFTPQYYYDYYQRCSFSLSSRNWAVDVRHFPGSLDQHSALSTSIVFPLIFLLFCVCVWLRCDSFANSSGRLALSPPPPLFCLFLLCIPLMAFFRSILYFSGGWRQVVIAETLATVFCFVSNVEDLAIRSHAISWWLCGTLKGRRN